MTPLCFIDTETTGLHPDRRAWEIAIIRRDDEGQRERLLQITDVDLSNAEPMGLKIGGFYERHSSFRKPAEWTEQDRLTVRLTERQAAVEVERLTRGSHLIGCVPDFDARTLDPMLRRHGLIPAWHHHLVDVEAMAVGWLNAFVRTPVRWITGIPDPIEARHHHVPGRLMTLPAEEASYGAVDPAVLDELLSPPWRSDDLARACQVEPPAAGERHTALGDARWAMRWYDAMVGAA